MRGWRYKRRESSVRVTPRGRYFGYGRRQYARIRELEPVIARAAAEDFSRAGLGLRLRYLSGGMSDEARTIERYVMPERSGYLPRRPHDRRGVFYTRRGMGRSSKCCGDFHDSRSRGGRSNAALFAWRGNPVVERGSPLICLCRTWQNPAGHLRCRLHQLVHSSPATAE